MIISSIMRAGMLATILAIAALVQGCSSPSSFTGTQQAMAPVNTGVYSGGDWDSALDATMTSDNGGD